MASKEPDYYEDGFAQTMKSPTPGSRKDSWYYDDVKKSVDDIIKHVGNKIVLGLPLGLGKPNFFANEIYRRAKENPKISLTIITALSLEKPAASSDLEQRFLGPFVKRVFGDYPDLDYVLDLRKNQLPPNIEVKEFFFKAGAFLNLPHVQQNYMSTNYTHAYRDIIDNGCNVVAQMITKKTIDGKRYYNTSCNPEVTLDVAKEMRLQEKEGKKIAIIGMVNENLPFMYGDAIVDADIFTHIIDNKKYYYSLFGAPKMSMTTADYMIGFNASTLIKDGGTLQIGIGSLGDALCYSLILRQKHNAEYKAILKELKLLDKFGDIINKIGGAEPLKEGLVGSTEMLVDGYMHLLKNDVIKRKTYNNVPLQRMINEGKIKETITPNTIDLLLTENAINSKLTEKDFKFLTEFGFFKEGIKLDQNVIIAGNVHIPNDLSVNENLALVKIHCMGTKLKGDILIHAGFFLGPNNFYEQLRNLSAEEGKKIFMTSVLNVNQLYGNQYGDEELKKLQRKGARFVNTCLMVTLSGAVCSDGLESGRMISGVGGQYNFVSQAHALEGGHSVLMCKSCRAGKEPKSNIVYNYGHLTIPRHLRDCVVTEYGVADIRGKSDKEIIAALLNITDSRFQEALLLQAKENKKIPDDYQIPEIYKNNTPEFLEKVFAIFKKKGLFPPFPFGCDFTKEELAIGKALKALKAKMNEGLGSKASTLSKAMTTMSIPDAAKPYLKRLDLDNPKDSKEKMMQKLVVHALAAVGVI